MTRHIHLEDIRLHNNAGISFPVCRLTRKGPLDLDASRLTTTGTFQDVTCPRCIARGPKRYPWARWAKKEKGTQ